MESVRSPPSSQVPSSDAVPSSWLCRQRSGLRTAVEGRVDKRLGVSQVGSENLAALDPEWLGEQRAAASRLAAAPRRGPGG